MRTLRLLNSSNVDSSKKRLPTREKFVIEQTAFAGAMPIKSAVGIILVFYYFSSLVMLHSLVTERISSQFVSLATICLFLATLNALAGLYHRQGGKFIPLLIIQQLGSFCSFWSSLTFIHFVCTYTIHRYVNILFAEKVDGRSPKQSYASVTKTSKHDKLTMLERDFSLYYDVYETPSKKKFVTFAV